MTIYIIKNCCIYDNINHELKSRDGTRAVKLTYMRSRCLDFILTHTQELVIKKNQISMALWEERSEFISDANLTQLLYLVRKDLRIFGVDDLFITIPRQGIKINDNIEIKHVEKNKNINQKKCIHYIILGLIILTITCVAILFFLT